MKVREAMDMLKEIEKTISIQDEIIGRIERGEVMLDRSYVTYLKSAGFYLIEYRDLILNAEVCVDR